MSLSYFTRVFIHSFIIAFLGWFIGFTPATSQIPNYVPSNGLVGWWPLSNNSNDISGNGYNGIISNGASYTTDRFGNSNSAIQMPGLLRLPVAFVFNQQSWSFAFWTRKDANLNHNPIQVGVIQGTEGVNFGWTTSSNSFRIYASRTNCGNLFTGSDCTAELGSWIHIAYVYAGSSISIYKNGTLCNVLSSGTGTYTCITPAMSL